MSPSNVLYIICDELSRQYLGCYDHPMVQTPNLDRLAARGTRFTNAYSNSPICVPVRAAIATGQYPHQTGYWDSVIAYDGRVPSWAHRLRDAGHEVVSIGKLHYQSAENDNGFTDILHPLYILNGIGFAEGLLRENPPPYTATRAYAEELGAGETSYTDYDRLICEATCEWLQTKGSQPHDKPWVLSTSFVSPHYPLIAPEAFFERYPPENVPLPFAYAENERPTHPGVTPITTVYNYDAHFQTEAQMRVAIAAYYGLTTFLDALVGQILDTLDECGLTETTRIIFTSDHGDMLGNHGIWAKSVMYEDSVAIPFIMAGPDVPSGQVETTPVSLIDLFPTILDAAGVPVDPAAAGQSLLDPLPANRAVLSEHHDCGSLAAAYMLRQNRWKYVYHVGHSPQLFDMVADPQERHDLGTHPDYASVVAQFEATLRTMLDPEAVNARAFRDQQAKIVELGGEEAILNLPSFGFTPLPSASGGG